MDNTEEVKTTLVADCGFDESPAPPFEGPEKVLEVWFTDPAELLAKKKIQTTSVGEHTGKKGLRAVTREAWQELLHLVKCEILSSTHNETCDAYLLRCANHSLYVLS